MSLPSPLTASDDYISSRGDGREKITMTAGLHRQVWVSGTSLFTDVHIANNSRRNIKRLELQVERIILCYRHVSDILDVRRRKGTKCAQTDCRCHIRDVRISITTF